MGVTRAQAVFALCFSILVAGFACAAPIDFQACWWVIDDQERLALQGAARTSGQGGDAARLVPITADWVEVLAEEIHVRFDGVRHLVAYREDKEVYFADPEIGRKLYEAFAAGTPEALAAFRAMLSEATSKTSRTSRSDARRRSRFRRLYRRIR